eukprot:869172-Alexandrium_andersonii.AAC.1
MQGVAGILEVLSDPPDLHGRGSNNLCDDLVNLVEVGQRPCRPQLHGHARAGKGRPPIQNAVLHLRHDGRLL